MNLIICFLLFLFALTAGWKQRQLVFTIEGRNVAGFPGLKDQYSGIDFNGTLYMQTHDPTTFILKFASMTYKKLHGDFENGWWNADTSQTSDNLEVKSSRLPISTEPFIIQLQKNVIKKIIVASSLKDWELNFIKGVIDKLILSVDTRKDNEHKFGNTVRDKSRSTSGEKDIKSYTMTEDSIIGKCEVLYDIVKIPEEAEELGDMWSNPMRTSLCNHKSLYEVTKTYNYSNCEFLAETHFNFPSSHTDPNCKPGGSSCENFWKRSTLSRAIGCSNSAGFAVLKSVTATTMTANVLVNDESKAVVNTRLCINLSKVETDQYESFKSIMPKDLKHVNDLMYSYTPKKWDPSSLCNKQVRERISGKTEESKKINEILFKDYNSKAKNNYRLSRSDSSKSKKHQTSTQTDNNEKKFDQNNLHKGLDDSYNNNDDDNSNKNKNNFSQDNLGDSKNNYDDKYNNNDDKTKNNENEDNYDEKYYNNGNNNYKNNGNVDLGNMHYNFNSVKKINKESKYKNYDGNSNFYEKEKKFLKYEPSDNYRGNSKSNTWTIETIGLHNPPFMPLTPFALAYKDNDGRNCLQEIFMDLIEQITYDLINTNVPVEEGTMEKISVAVDMCQIMTFKELLSVNDSLFYSSLTNYTFSDASDAKRKLFRDIISTCGTKPALSLIGKWIDDNQLSDNEGALIFTTLPARLLSADSETVDFYFEMVKKVSNSKHKIMMTAAIIGFSNFIRFTCVERKDNRFNPQVEEICDSNNAEDFVNWMSTKLRDNEEETMMAVFSLAIGNTGSKSSLKTLKLVANNYNLSSYQRSRAIYAMKYLAILYPSYAEPVLYSIYCNYSAPVPVRLAALSTLIFSNPPPNVWQRIALSTWYEPNLSVTSFIQSTINSLSETHSENPKIYQEITQSASLVRHLMKPKLSYSRKPVMFNILESSYLKELKMVIFDQSTWIGSADSMSIYYRHFTRNNGFSNQFETEFSSSNPDSFLNSLKLLILPPNGDIDETFARPPIKNLPRSTNWIHRKLGLTTRQQPSLEGDFRFKINNLIETIIPFNRETTISLADWGQQFLSQLRGEGLQERIQKVDMSSTVLSTATELGFPVRLQMRAPWIFQSTADMNLINTNSLNMSFSLRFSSGKNGELSFFTPWDNTAYIAGIYGSCFSQIPKTKFSVELNHETSSVLIKTEAIDNSKLLFHSTYPFTSQKDLVEHQLTITNPETRIVHVDKMKQRSLNPHLHLQGVYRTEGKMYSDFELLSQVMLRHQPMMWHSNKLTHIEIGLNNMGPTVLNFTLDRATLDDGYVMLHKTRDSFDNEPNQNNKLRRQVTRSIWSKLFNWWDDETTETPCTTATTIPTEPITLVTDTPTDAADHNPTYPTSEAETTTVVSPAPENETNRGGNSSSITRFGDFTLILGEKNKDHINYDDLKFEKLGYVNDEKRFTASNINPFINQVNGSSQFSLISEILNGMKSGYAFVVGMNALVNKLDGGVTKYSSFWAYGSTTSKSLQRLGYFASANNSNSQIRITAAIEMPPLPAFNVESVVKNQGKPHFDVNFVHISDLNNISLSLQGEIEQKASVLDLKEEIIKCRRSETAASVKCRNIYSFVTSFNEVKANVIVNENDSSKSYIEWFAAWVAVGGKEYLVQQNFNPKGKINNGVSDVSNALQMSVSFNDSNFWKGWINSSIVDSNFRGVSFPYKSMVSTVVSLYEELAQINSQYCSIKDNKVVTFDGLEYNYNLTDCWHVAAKDCSGKSRFVVLVRLLENKTSLDFEINIGNYKIVGISGSSLTLNGKDVQFSSDGEAAVVLDRAGTVLVRIERTVDHAFDIFVPAHGFKLLYANSSAIIHAYSELQSRLCGLCGDYNLEIFGELQNPNRAQLNNAIEFGAHYSLSDGNCFQHIYS